MRQRTGRTVSLRVADGDTKGGRSGGNKPTTIRQSKSGRRRAIVLGIVQLLLIAHLIQWLIMGTTTTPIEPSESMEFSKHGVINVGLIFFALALLSTLVLGRWFCGWGCHVVLLQDLCGWIMRKMGIRPKPFRSRLLIYVPLLLALYMFIWPMAYRWGLVPLDRMIADSLGAEHFLVTSIRVPFNFFGVALPAGQLPPWELSSHITTDSFWGTFAPWVIAIPFLLICGFGCVYFLGSKGFCTYGCPYGGFFAPIDKLSPARIRVTDACEHCGHCTAVCTSNVRVHEEVYEYGMVVDPGCMKCLDCVSVCPNDALYFGFGKPAMMKGRAQEQRAQKREAKRRKRELKVQEHRNSRPRKRFDLTWPEEIGLAATFAVTFIGTRSAYGMIPMLMAVGIAGCVTFLAWKLWRILREDNVNLHRYRLKFKGSLSRSGWLFTGLTGFVLLLTLHTTVVRGSFVVAEGFDRQVTVPAEETFSATPSPMPESMQRHAQRALSLYQLASSVSEGGIGLPGFWQDEIDFRMARLHAAQLDFEAAEHKLQSAIQRSGPNDALSSSLMWVLRAQDRTDDAIAFAKNVVVDIEQPRETLAQVISLLVQNGRADEAMNILQQRLEQFGDSDQLTMRWLVDLHLHQQQFEQAERIQRMRLENGIDDPNAWGQLAGIQLLRNNIGGALETLNRGLRQHPDSRSLNLQMAELLEALGHRSDAQRYYEKASSLSEPDPNAARHR